MAKLLVSVRSAIEASTAVAAGAAIIDIKEPLRGSLGRAPCSAWTAVRAAVSRSIPISVALGELSDWFQGDAVDVPPASWAGVSYCKLGLAAAHPGWVSQWRAVRRRLRGETADLPAWVAVIYIDWQRAGAPPPLKSAPEAEIDGSRRSRTREAREIRRDRWAAEVLRQPVEDILAEQVRPIPIVACRHADASVDRSE